MQFCKPKDEGGTVDEEKFKQDLDQWQGKNRKRQFFGIENQLLEPLDPILERILRKRLDIEAPKPINYKVACSFLSKSVNSQILRKEESEAKETKAPKRKAKKEIIAERARVFLAVYDQVVFARVRAKLRESSSSEQD